MASKRPRALFLGKETNVAYGDKVIGTKIRRAKRLRGVKLIVADPRHIDIAEHADLFLRNRPGTDIALLNGIMHVIVREGWHDESFVAERTEGFEEMRTILEKYTPDFASEITGADMVITTYATAVRDIDAIAGIEWSRMVLDEAQAIKNAATASAAPSPHARSASARSGVAASV